MDIKAHFKEVVKELFSYGETMPYRQVIADELKATASAVEENIVAENRFREEISSEDAGLTLKMELVEKQLLKDEAVFYQEYGMVMPEKVREVMRARAWDSLDQEKGGKKCLN